MGFVEVSKAGKNAYLHININGQRTVSAGDYQPKGFHQDHNELSKYQYSTQVGVWHKIKGMDTDAMLHHLQQWDDVSESMGYQIAIYYKGRKSSGKNPSVWSWMAKLLQVGVPAHIPKDTRKKWTPLVIFNWTELDVLKYAGKLAQANLGGYRAKESRFLALVEHDDE